MSLCLQVEEAGQVFLLMKKDYRISRNVRLAWFLNHLHQTVQATPQEMLVRSRNVEAVRGWPQRICSFKRVLEMGGEINSKRSDSRMGKGLCPQDDSTGEMLNFPDKENICLGCGRWN